MKRTIAVLLLIALPFGAARAAEIFEKVGTYDATFLKIGVGARAAGMGDAFVAVADDGSASYWNAAGVAHVARTELMFNHNSWVGGLLVDQFAYVFSIKGIPGNWSLDARSLSMDRQEETEPYHPEGTGRTFDAGYAAFGLTYSRFFTDKFSAGVSARLVTAGLAESEWRTVTFDVGSLYDVGLGGIRIGMVIQNIGGNVKYSHGAEVADIDVRTSKMPTMFRVGVSARPLGQDNSKLLTAMEFSHPPDNREHLNVGAEYQFNNYLFLRGGYKFGYDSENWAGGVGVRFPVSAKTKAQVDYAYANMQTLGAAHRVSLKFDF
ncbi:MAG: PorV/PorQ family protein [Candidatus Eisenbacteria bacterium]|nr:PorV/PorQ family protein [Candidatus Eisenbacteria bacterium]